jgi:hypothetical protein
MRLKLFINFEKKIYITFYKIFYSFNSLFRYLILGIVLISLPINTNY